MSTAQQQKDLKPRVVTDPHLRPRRPQRQLPVTDIRQTKEYKTAARRWVSTIVALPILMYTSYVLFERTYGDKQPKRLPERPSSNDASAMSTTKPE
ncbi:hypothetical protein BJX99DRAFT_233489 [Aspergillus californicus]